MWRLVLRVTYADKITCVNSFAPNSQRIQTTCQATSFSGSTFPSWHKVPAQVKLLGRHTAKHGQLCRMGARCLEKREDTTRLFPCLHTTADTDILQGAHLESSFLVRPWHTLSGCITPGISQQERLLWPSSAAAVPSAEARCCSSWPASHEQASTLSLLELCVTLSVYL